MLIFGPRKPKHIEDPQKTLIRPKIVISPLSIILLAICMILLILPVWMDSVKDHEYSEAMTSYTQSFNGSEGIPQYAYEYNKRLALMEYDHTVAIPKYEDLLVSGNQAFAYMELRPVNQRLPIFHGITEEALQQGAGHYPTSSLPVGGLGCHCVLTGHSGMPGYRMFDDLYDMEIGDLILIHVCGDTLAYRVYATHIVKPEEANDYFKIDKERDLLSLMTCYPYGVNTHRLLVQAERTDYNPDIEIPENIVPTLNKRSKPFFYGACLLLMLFLFWLYKRPHEIKGVYGKYDRKDKTSKIRHRWWRYDYFPPITYDPTEKREKLTPGLIKEKMSQEDYDFFYYSWVNSEYFPDASEINDLNNDLDEDLGNWNEIVDEVGLNCDELPDRVADKPDSEGEEKPKKTRYLKTGPEI